MCRFPPQGHTCGSVGRFKLCVAWFIWFGCGDGVPDQESGFLSHLLFPEWFVDSSEFSNPSVSTVLFFLLAPHRLMKCVVPRQVPCPRSARQRPAYDQCPVQ